MVATTSLVTVVDGQLTVRLQDLGGKDKKVAITGLTVTYVGPVEAAAPLAAAPSCPTVSPLQNAAATANAEDDRAGERRGLRSPAAAVLGSPSRAAEWAEWEAAVDELAATSLWPG